MTYGIKVAVPGYSVETAQDINLSLKTDFTLLKVKQSGTIDISGGSVEITHSLGYAPQFLVFGKLDSGAILPTVTIYIASEIFGISSWVDSNKLYITPDPNFSTAYYYIFYEQL